MKIICIGGEHGSGKSTLMYKILGEHSWKLEYNKVKFVPYLTNTDGVYVLGKYFEQIGIWLKCMHNCIWVDRFKVNCAYANIFSAI